MVAVDDADQMTYSDTIVVLGTEQNKLATGGYASARFELGGNYPNPFNAHTTIGYNLPHESPVILEVFDVLGRKIETLVDGNQAPGPHSVVWDADYVSTGMYFYRFQADNYSETRRMSIIK